VAPGHRQERARGERFKEINQAYEVLSDEDKRARYDRFGMAGVNGPTGGGYPGAAGFGGFEEIFEEIFSNFGGVRTSTSRRRGPKAGSDRRVDVTITFEEAVFGAEKEVEYDRLLRVRHRRSGAPPAPAMCAVSSVKWQRRSAQGSANLPRAMVQVATSPRCGGKGETVATHAGLRGAGASENVTLGVRFSPACARGCRIMSALRRRRRRQRPSAISMSSCTFRATVLPRKDNDIISMSALRCAGGAWVTVHHPTVEGEHRPAGTGRHAKPARSSGCAARASRAAELRFDSRPR